MLYVVDLYHGIVQHKAYLSAYLYDQVEKRHLDENTGHRGRIWRIVADSAKTGPPPHLSKAPMEELVANLSQPRRLVARHVSAAHRRAKPVEVDSAGLLNGGRWNNAGRTPLAKVHALWALSALDRVEDETAAAALKDADPRVRLTAMRVAELMVRKHVAPRTTAAMAKLANDPDASVQLQILVTASPDLPELQPGGDNDFSRRIWTMPFSAAPR